MSVSNIQELKKAMLSNLESNILKFWMDRTIDQEYGGFIGEINNKNEVVADANKGVILNTRILWTFSYAARILKNKKYQEIADRAFEYVMNYFVDYEHGGVFWEIDYKGNPVSDRKQIYAQAFTIYALSEYYSLNSNAKALELAKKIFWLIEKYSYDKKLDGYIEAFTRDWKDLEDVRLSDKDINAKKTMNTHLHILEAYTNLYRVWQDEELRTAQINLINLFYRYFINKENHLVTFYNEKWESYTNQISYGHDIEASWLLHEASEVVNHPDKKRSEDTAVRIVNATIKEGMDSNGGINYDFKPDENHLDTDKHWWVQAEGVVGLVNAYQITSDKIYLDSALKLWDFIEKNLIDKTNGEWFYMVNKEGKTTDDVKVGFWKCPYHNSRACLEIAHRL